MLGIEGGVCRTQHGQRYVPRSAVISRNTFTIHPISKSIFPSRVELKQYYGPGIVAYFDFINILILYNVLLTAIAAIAWVQYIATTRDALNFHSFFVSSYATRSYWFATGVAMFILWFGLALLYFIRERC